MSAAPLLLAFLSGAIWVWLLDELEQHTVMRGVLSLAIGIGLGLFGKALG